MGSSVNANSISVISTSHFIVIEIAGAVVGAVILIFLVRCLLKRRSAKLGRSIENMAYQDVNTDETFDDDAVWGGEDDDDDDELDVMDDDEF